MIYILGVGNTLLKDDGIGVRIVAELQKKVLPKNIRLIDVGTGILRILPELVQASKIIIVDAIKGGGEPGTIYRFKGTIEPGNLTRSVHDLQFDEVLIHLKMMGYHPEVEYFGIEPKEINFSMDLSTEVSEKIPILVDYIYQEIIMEELNENKKLPI